MRKTTVFGMALYLAFPLRALASSGDLQLEQYLREIPAQNSAYQVARQAYEAALASVDVASALSDPNVSIALFASEVETRVGPQRQKLSIEEKLPWPGKLALRGRAARQRAAAIRRNMDAVLLQLVVRFKELYAELFYIGKTVAITEDHLALLRSLEDVVTDRYRTRAAGYTDLLRIQLEIDTMADRLKSRKASAMPVISEMNALLGRPVSGLIPFPGQLEALPKLGNEERATWERRLQERNPTLQALDHISESNRTSLALARKERFPDFHVGLEWINTAEAIMPVAGSGEDPLILKFGLNLPIWKKKNRGRERVAAAQLEKATAQRKDTTLHLRTRLAQAVFHYEDAGRKLALYRNQVVPKARESLDITLAAFQTGDAGYLDLIDTEKGLLAFLLSLNQAEADRLKAAAAIEAVIGEPPFGSRTVAETKQN